MGKNDFNMKNETKKFKNNVKKDIEIIQKPPWKWSEKDKFMLLSSSLIIFGIVPKILNVQQWFATDFDMSSYSPWSLAFYYPYTLIYLYISWNKRIMSFVVLGLVGLITTLMITYGIIKVYLPLDPII